MVHTSIRRCAVIFRSEDSAREKTSKHIHILLDMRSGFESKGQDDSLRTSPAALTERPLDAREVLVRPRRADPDGQPPLLPHKALLLRPPHGREGEGPAGGGPLASFVEIQHDLRFPGEILLGPITNLKVHVHRIVEAEAWAHSTRRLKKLD